MASQLKAEHDLFEACREWRRLAEAEGEAIRTGNWGLCAACQKALQNLRERMTALLPGVRAEWAQPGGDHAARQQQFDDTLRQLIQLQRRNHTLVQAVRAATHAKIQQLNQARIKLKQLRRSYGFTCGPALNAFS
jgi:ketosteroid isomerase-like protein